MATITRASTRMVSELPSRWNSRSCSTRSSLACRPNGRSPISSRKMVPRWASSKRPMRWLTAPVNAPLTCPNSSASSRASGSALQLTATNEKRLRPLAAWMERAANSLPVPVSPLMRTVARRGATRRICSAICRMGRLSPIKRRPASDSTGATLASCAHLEFAAKYSRLVQSPSANTWNAPSRSKRTTSVGDAWGARSTIGVPGWACCSTSNKPNGQGQSASGRQTSTTSKSCCRSSSRPSSARLTAVVDAARIPVENSSGCSVMHKILGFGLRGFGLRGVMGGNLCCSSIGKWGKGSIEKCA